MKLTEMEKNHLDILEFISQKLPHSKIIEQSNWRGFLILQISYTIDCKISTYSSSYAGIYKGINLRFSDINKKDFTLQYRWFNIRGWRTGYNKLMKRIFREVNKKTKKMMEDNDLVYTKGVLNDLVPEHIRLLSRKLEETQK